MTKKLLIVRHAKAEPETIGQRDFDRELSMTGIMQTSKMGKFLHDSEITPDLILASPAARTLATARLLAEQINFDFETIQTLPELYNGSVKTWMDQINSLSPELNTVMFVGHNPYISYLAEYLSGEATGDLPTCGMVLLAWDDLTWAEISGKTGKVIWQKQPE
jgi:phosphohistidine phosphatase